jgi:hypothetical protein
VRSHQREIVRWLFDTKGVSAKQADVASTAFLCANFEAFQVFIEGERRSIWASGARASRK